MEMTMRVLEECHHVTFNGVEPEQEESQPKSIEECDSTEDYTNEELLLEYQNTGSQDIMEQIYTNNYRLICSLARKYKDSGVEMEDLIGVGNLQLVKCIRSYNPGRKQKFSSYLYKSVEQQMLSYIQANMTNLSVSIREMRKINDQVYSAKHKEICTSTDEVQADQALNSIRPLSLDSEQVSEQAVEDTNLSNYERKELLELIIGRLRARLTENQFEMLAESEGLLGEEPLSMAEIARRHGKTEGAVRGAKNIALYRLRQDTKLKLYLYQATRGV